MESTFTRRGSCLMVIVMLWLHSFIAFFDSCHVACLLSSNGGVASRLSSCPLSPSDNQDQTSARDLDSVSNLWKLKQTTHGGLVARCPLDSRIYPVSRSSNFLESFPAFDISNSLPILRTQRTSYLYALEYKLAEDSARSQCTRIIQYFCLQHVLLLIIGLSSIQEVVWLWGHYFNEYPISIELYVLILLAFDSIAEVCIMSLSCSLRLAPAVNMEVPASRLEDLEKA